MKKNTGLTALERFDVSPDRGFLPKTDPLLKLPKEFSPWDEIARDLPKLLAAENLGSAIEALPLLDPAPLRGQENNAAMRVLSFLGHAWVWEKWKQEVRNRIPPQIAVPWYRVAKRLGRPPILSYASYALDNWRRLDPSGPIALGNIALIQNFLGGLDEEWFILVHIEIEKRAGVALAAIGLAEQAVADNNPTEVERNLALIASSLREMHTTLRRMPENCDPYMYYNRVRPYIHGWKNHPTLQGGVIYEGIDIWQNAPQEFRGETGAQSTIVPIMDAILNIQHADDPLRPYLLEMQTYMPPKHRRFLRAVERDASIRAYVIAHHKDNPSLKDAYNECVHWLAAFRTEHLGDAATYINKQAQRSSANPTGVGTGGTPFMAYLKKHRDETLEHMIQ